MKSREYPPVVVWVRNAFRLHDNHALHEAIQSGRPVVMAFVWDDSKENVWQLGTMSRVWLHFSLKKYSESVAKLGGRLLLRRGNPYRELSRIAEESGATTIFVNRNYEQHESDKLLKDRLIRSGYEVWDLPGNVLIEPWQVFTQAGTPYKVYTQFWNRLLQMLKAPQLLNEVEGIRWHSGKLESLGIEDYGFLPDELWWEDVIERWDVGEKAALEALDRFLGEKMFDYADKRDRPDWPSTSKLSPHLRFGELSPRMVLYRLAQSARSDHFAGYEDGAKRFLQQIGWREFAQYLMHHFPETKDEPLREQFKAFPWREDPEALEMWKRGETGFPVVDAGMRELKNTGWMHNRVRMIVASFLTKDLLIPWQEGAKWFWEKLVDADLPNNTLGWQWTAGCGADAQPFFRVFNPVTQGKRFDPDGDYVRRWVPELRNLSTKYIHQPWEAPDKALEDAAISMGKTYPMPIVDHSMARQRALAAYDMVKGVIQL